MIIVYSEKALNSVQIPSPTAKIGGDLILVLQNTSTRKIYTIPFNDEDSNPNYYHADISFDGLPKGEYSYTLCAAAGLLKII